MNLSYSPVTVINIVIAVRVIYVIYGIIIVAHCRIVYLVHVHLILLFKKKIIIFIYVKYYSKRLTKTTYIYLSAINCYLCKNSI